MERFPVPKLPGEETSSPMEVENLGDSHPDDSQGEEIPSEELAIVGPNETGADLGEKAQDEALIGEVQDAAQLQGKDQEDVFDDDLP